MFVIIAGGGRTSTYLARNLLKQDHTVRVIESRPKVIASLHKELPTEVIIEGNPMNSDVFKQAKPEKAQVFVAVTTNDEENLVLCCIARTKYNINRTIARVNNPRNAWLFNQTFGVDVPVNHAEIMSSLIEEEMSLGDMMTLLKLRKGNYALVEEKIPPRAIAIGQAIKDLNLPEQCVLAAIFRKGEVVVPHGNTVFEVGDEVMAITDQEGAKQFQKVFSDLNTVNGKNQ
ncbi:MAG: TrkA family potassium uptake protein [Anaerolineaceae bacterium]|nr:TrkA family potassium uptake protein [Anaerolineaceae bacterium]